MQKYEVNVKKRSKVIRVVKCSGGVLKFNRKALGEGAEVAKIN
jgi:hypothetical protein